MAESRADDGGVQLREGLGAGGAAEGAGQATRTAAAAPRERQQLLEVEGLAREERGTPDELVGPRHGQRNGGDAGGHRARHPGPEVAGAADDDDAGATGGGGGQSGLEAETAALEHGRQLRSVDAAIDDHEGIVSIDGTGQIDARGREGGGAGGEPGLETAIEVAVR